MVGKDTLHFRPSPANVALLSQAAFSCLEQNIRFASSNNRIYIEDGAVCSPSQISAHVVNRYSSVAPNQLLEEFSPNSWLLKAELYIVDGSTLNLIGTDAGGDTDKFYLLSKNGETPYHVKVRAIYGNLMMRSTEVMSWDPDAEASDHFYKNGRAHINVNSYEQGGEVFESRWDIIDSEVSYLGYSGSETSGLVWKVRGGSDDPSVYDRVKVYGNVMNSSINNNYTGIYTLGSFQKVIENSELKLNVHNGIYLRENSHKTEIRNNELTSNGKYGIVSSGGSSELVISGNYVGGWHSRGIALLWDTIDSVVKGNNVEKNGTGIALTESHRNLIINNTVRENGHGIRLSLGSGNNLVKDNVIEINSRNGLYQYMGTSAPKTTNGRPSNNIYEGNYIKPKYNGVLVKLRDSDGAIFKGNTFDWPKDIQIYDSTDVQFLGNDYIDAYQNKNIVFRLNGASMLGGEATVILDQDLRANISENVELNLLNKTGRILDPSEKAGEITVSETSEEGVPIFVSHTRLQHADIGKTTDVSALDFWVEPSGGDVILSGISFGKDLNPKSWTTRASRFEPEVTYTIGGLMNYMNYQVTRNGEEIAVITASDGQIQFSDTALTAMTEYEVAVDESAPSGIVADPFRGVRYNGGSTGIPGAIYIKRSGGYYWREAYLKFDISGYEQEVKSAVLTLSAGLVGSCQCSVDVLSTADWDPSSWSWDSRPVVHELLDRFVVDSRDFNTYTIDFTDYINNLIRSGETVASIGLHGTVKTSSIIRVNSREYDGLQKPTLFIFE